jgi:protease-4
MDPSSIQSYLPLIAKMAKGESVDFNQPKIESYSTLTASSTDSSGKTIKGKVGVIRVRGAIVKSSDWCTDGTEAKNERLKAMLADNSIDAVVLDLDTPGGQVSFLETFANTIKTAQKPIVAYYNNQCASAGYYIAAPCDEIYASEKSDTVGSIGTMATLADYSKYFENQGITVHYLFAEQSTEKNKDYMDLISGDPEKVSAAKKSIVKKVLSPIAEDFINLVKSEREISDENAFKGAVYLTNEAIENGLIDGIKSFDEVLSRAVELAANPTKTEKSNTAMSNKFKKVATLLGYEAIEQKDGHVSLSAEDMEKIDSAFPDPSNQTEGAAAEKSGDESDELTGRVNAMENGMKKNSEDLVKTNKKLDQINAKLDQAISGGAAGATQTETKKDEFDEQPKNGLDAIGAPEMAND